MLPAYGSLLFMQIAQQQKFLLPLSKNRTEKIFCGDAALFTFFRNHAILIHGKYTAKCGLKQSEETPCLPKSKVWDCSD